MYVWLESIIALDNASCGCVATAKQVRNDVLTNGLSSKLTSFCQLLSCRVDHSRVENDFESGGGLWRKARWDLRLRKTDQSGYEY